MTCITSQSFRRFRSPLKSLLRPWAIKPSSIFGPPVAHSNDNEEVLDCSNFTGQMETVNEKLYNIFPFCHGTQTYNSCQPLFRGVKYLNSPTSPQARFFAMGPITTYLTTSLTTRKCSVVNGCSYIIVFIAGNMYVGVWGDNARSREV